MESGHEHGRPRTLFGELLRQRRQTAEAFSEEAEKFAREHCLDATLSPRHVQRLMSGHRADGKPLGPVRLVTRRLLEEMLNVPADQLLQPVPAATATVLGSSDDALQLRARIATGRNLDAGTVSLLRQKLDITRVIDRRLGASALLGELQHQIEQMEQALGNVLNQQIRSSLAEVVVDASALAGWQSLDQGLVTNAWNHYNRARSAAREADSRALEAYACAGQAVVLLDVGDTRAATELTEHARTLAKGRVPRLLQAWLTAGYGEACAAQGDRRASMLAFDEALNSMPSQHEYDQTPYLVFDPTHLARWRGSALARLGEPEAVDVLSDVLNRLDPTFTRAATALRVDLVQVLTATGEREAAMAHAEPARLLAAQVGSTRQRRRLDALLS
jgi:tetratricopeptide (TPR) repeat protein